MELKKFIKRFYFDMITNELRLMSDLSETPNITYNSLLYLDMIAYRENCTVSFLAESLKVAKSAVTFKVNELVRQNLVVKTQSEIDKRVHYLSVSGKMIEEYKLYNSCLQGAIDDIKNAYSQRDITVFCDMLAQISGHFTKGADIYNGKHTIQAAREG